MVAEGPFDPAFMGIDKTFEHELRFCRNPHIDGFALNDFKRLLSAKNRQR